MRRLARYPRFFSRDPEESDRVIGGGARFPYRTLRTAPDFSITRHLATLDLVRVSALSCPVAREIYAPPSESYIVTVIQEGSLATSLPLPELFPGDACLYAPDYEMHCQPSGNFVVVGLSVEAESMRREAESLVGRPVKTPFEATGAFPMAAPPGRLVEYLLDELDRADNLLGPASLAGRQIERALMTALVESTPNTYSSLVGRGSLQPADGHVRAAETYMEAHLLEPLSTGDLARAAGVSARALQDAFRRRRDSTPLRVLRVLRLNWARRALEHPFPDTSVARVAAQCGYSNLGRLTRDYQQQHRERPTDTLRRGQRKHG